VQAAYENSPEFAAVLEWVVWELAYVSDARHLMHDGRLEEHRLSSGPRLRDDGLLVYDAGQPPLL
jgi:hypothetical protein